MSIYISTSRIIFVLLSLIIIWIEPLAKKSLIHKEKKMQIGKKISFDSLILKKKRNGKFMESYNPHRVIVHRHQHCFSTIRPRANYRDFGLSQHLYHDLSLIVLTNL